MKRKALLAVLGLTFLFISSATDVALVKSNWAGFLGYGFSVIMLQILLLFYWPVPRLLVQLYLTACVILFLFMCVVRAEALDALLSAHTAGAGLNHLIDFIRSPFPLMVTLICVTLYNKEQHS